MREACRRLSLVLAIAFVLISCGGGAPSDPPANASVSVEVTMSAAIPIDIPIIPGASDPFGGNAAGTALLDHDGDGRQDLLITPSYLYQEPELPVILLRSTATGFVDATSAAFGASIPTTGVARTPLVADFNGDGKDDYFAADHGLEVVVDGSFIFSENALFTTGPGATLTASKLPTLAFNHGACMGDIDSSGRIDIVVTPLSSPKTYVLRNTASGFVFDQTTLPAELTSYTTMDFNPSSCALADITGDGTLDLVAAGYGDGVAAGSPGAPYATGTRVFLNDGTGTFLASTSTLPRPPGADWGSTSIRVADFDNDGLRDILIAFETPDRRFALQLWMQTSNGVFEDRTVSALGGYETSIGFWREMDVGDFNGDGHVDIYLRVLGAEQGTFAESLRQRILLNDGTGTFAPITEPIALSQPVAPIFLLPSTSTNGTLTLVGYQATISGASYTSLTPLTLQLAF